MSEFFRFSLPIDPINPLDFLSAGTGQARAFFRTADQSLTFAAFQPISNSENALELIKADPNATPARLFGGMQFDPTQPNGGAWARFPECGFWLYQYEYLETPDGAWLTINTTDKTQAKQQLDTLLLSIKPHQTTESGVRQPHNLVHHTGWNWMVDQAITRINSNGLEKVVLARPISIRTPNPFDVIAILDSLLQQYPHTYHFLLEPEPMIAFIGASPERLIKTKQGQLKTSAMAGSTPRGETVEADLEQVGNLLKSGKDQHEHKLVVDQIVQQLKPFTANVSHPTSPIIHALPNIYHLLTPINAEINQNVHPLDIVKALHPTPALGGTPRNTAMQMIRNLEEYPRGWYGSPIGWYDNEGNAEFVVGIRSAIISRNTAWAYAGAGIVADSKADYEWEETRHKLKPMLTALGVFE